MMPNLISELRAAVQENESERIREIVVLVNRRVMFMGRQQRFGLFGDDTPDLRLCIAWLDQMGCSVDIMPWKTSIHRIVPEFYDWLCRSA